MHWIPFRFAYFSLSTDCFGSEFKISSVCLCADSTRSHTYNRHGGLKWMDSWSFHFLLGHTAYSSGSCWVGQRRGWAIGSATQSMSTVGTLSRSSSDWQHRMAYTPSPSVTWRVTVGPGPTTTLEIFLLRVVPTRPQRSSSRWTRSTVPTPKVGFAWTPSWFAPVA